MDFAWLSVGVALVYRASGQLLESNSSFESMLQLESSNNKNEDEKTNSSDVLEVLGLAESDLPSTSDILLEERTKQIHFSQGKWLKVRSKCVGEDKIFLEISSIPDED